jgi:hypothetical protein
MFAGTQLDSSPVERGESTASDGRRGRLACTALKWSQLEAVTMSEERLSRNEAIFREINERTRSLQERFGPEDPSTRYEQFLCECGDQMCVERVNLTVPEYEFVRAESTQFVLRPGHTIPRVERIVEENDRYVVVVKLGEAAEVAAERDPRS